jgi:hypothetical protein
MTKMNDHNETGLNDSIDTAAKLAKTKKYASVESVIESQSKKYKEYKENIHDCSQDQKTFCKE